MPVVLSAESGALPTEFRIFKQGWNDTEKGALLFDDAAAKSVMAAATKWGVDLMIDLEHQALTGTTPPEPTARDARGWFRLEVRAGELWAVNVKWTADGEARLLEGRQRYVSPAAMFDPETMRVTAIRNVAITSIPATHDTPALIAASAIGESMDPNIMKEAIEVIASGDEKKALEILKGMIASAAGAAEEEAAEEVAEEPAPEMAAVPAEEEEKKEEVAAASARLLRLTCKNTFGGALDEVETWRQSHINLAAREAELAKEKAALELSKRKENAITLTKLGAETPATTGLADGKLCARLLSEPLDEQNKRVAVMLAAKGGKGDELKPPAADTKPAKNGDLVVTLSNGEKRTLKSREVAMCTEMKIDLKDYAATKPAEKDQ